MKSTARVAHCVLAAVLLASATPVTAQSYPAKPILWIAASAPGGAFDLLTRALANPLTTNLGRPIVADNRAAVSGITGMEATARLNREIVCAVALPEMTKVTAAMNVIPATSPVIKGLKIEME